MRTSRSVLILLVLSGLTFLAGLGRPAITDADEAFYAEASREMVESGDWLTPRFDYRDRWEKPVLYYWLTATVYQLAGPSEWGARIWSALAGIGLTLLTWSVARRAGPPAQGFDAPLLAGAIVATSFGYFAEARMALPDLPLAFFITLTVWAALRASLDVDAGWQAGWWLIAGISAGLGFLTKGPVAIVVPSVVLLPIWWRASRSPLGGDRRLIGLPRGLMIAAAAAAIVGLPWYVAMWAEHGTPYLRSFFIGDNIERFATGRFNERRIPGFYLAILLGGLLPWSAYLIALTAGSLPHLRRLALSLMPAERRLVIWAVAPLILFTVSVGQQPRYILPVLPPVAVLLARALVQAVERARSGRPAPALRLATWATAALFLLMAALLARAQPLFVTAFPALTWAGVAATAVTGLLIAAVAGMGAWSRLPAVLAGSAAMLLLSVQFGVLAGRRPEPVEEMAALVVANRTGDEPVAAYQTFVRNLIFYTRFRQVELAVEPEAVGFVQSPRRVLLIIDAEDRDQLQAVSGVPLRTIAAVRYLNTANVKIGTILQPDPAKQLRSVLLVTNR